MTTANFSRSQEPIAPEISYDAIVSFDGNSGAITSWNQQAESLFDWSKVEVLGRSFMETVLPAESRATFQKNLEELKEIEGEEASVCERIELKVLKRDGSAFPIEITLRPFGSEGFYNYTTFIRDISERKRDELVKSGQNQVFEMLATGRSLPEILGALIEIIEYRFDVRCSVLLTDPDEKHLRCGSAPSLPQEFNQAVDGLEIGPCSGSCGTAAYRCDTVVIEDIKTDPLWAGFRELGLQSGIRSCWSKPILSEKGKVLGTLCMYYAEARRPLPEEAELMETTVRLASIAIERRMAMTELENKLKEVEHFREMILARDERIQALKDEILQLKSKGGGPPMPSARHH